MAVNSYRSTEQEVNEFLRISETVLCDRSFVPSRDIDIVFNKDGEDYDEYSTYNTLLRLDLYEDDVCEILSNLTKQDYYETCPDSKFLI